MALPTSPSVVVLENDVSVFAPNVDSSVVGVVGFADKGPTNKATLITSPENLIRKFGEPKTAIPGQGLEGAIEILEATNQMYFVRAANTGAAEAEVKVTVGASPAFLVSGFDGAAASSIYYSVYGNDGLFKASSVVTTKAIDSTNTSLDTAQKVISAAFSRDAQSQAVISYIEGTDIYLASKYAGSGAYMQLSSVSGTRDQGFRFVTVEIDGDASAVGAFGEDNARLSNNTAYGYTASADLNFEVYSIYPGSGYNLTVENDGATKGLSVEVDNLGINDKLVVNSDGGQVESFNVNLQPSSLEYARTLLFEDSANDYRNNNSEYIYTDIETSTAGTDYDGFPDLFGQKITEGAGFQGNPAQPSAVATDRGSDNGTPRFVKLVEGTYKLAGGDSGYENTEDPQTGVDITALIGTATKKTGIYALDEDRLNISLAVAPGFSDDALQNALITLGESSKNFFALIAPPYGFDEVQDAIDWINGAGARTAALNTSYAAVYWPWVQVFNPFAGKEEWYDPSIFAARQCVFTDSVNDPWFAPAGFRRGRLTKPTATEIVVNQGDRDALYANNVNPISNEPTTGITIFGQKTAQRLPTALDRVNVRRLMIYIRKVLLELGKPFQFEPNDSFTWEQVTDAINPFLGDLLARRAIVEGAVKCDSSTNTPLRVDRNELWCSVTIKPTKAAETVVFEVNLTSQSATIA